MGTVPEKEKLADRVGINRRLDGIDARFERIESDIDEIKRNVRLLVDRMSARPRKARR